MGESFEVTGALVPCDGWCAPRDVLIRDGVVAAVAAPDGAPLPPPLPGETRTKIACEHETRLLMPGLHNAHTHSSNYFIKGGMDSLPLELMVSCSAMLPLEHPWKQLGIGYGKRTALGAVVDHDAIEQNRYRLGALATGLHSLMSGATSLVDMIGLPDGDDDRIMRCLAAAAEGYKQSGVRVFLGPQFDDSKDEERFHDCDTENSVKLAGKTANFLAPTTGERRDKATAAMRASGLRGLGEDGSLRTERWPSDPEKTSRAIRIWRRAIKELHRPDEGVHIILSPHNERTCSEEMFRECAAIMREYDDVHATVHLLEGMHQPLGGGPRGDDPDGVSWSVRVLDDCGFLTPRTTLAHAVHLTKGDMNVLAERGCLVSHNPISNLRLGAGIANILAMKAAGVKVGIGVDGAGSGVECQDVLAAAKLACLLPNVKTPEYRNWLKPRDVLLEMGCRCGRESVGLCASSTSAKMTHTATADIDKEDEDDALISVGRVADLVLYDLTSLSLLPRADPFTSILLSGARPGGAAAGSQIDVVWVNGKQVVVGGDSTTVDVIKVRSEILEAGPPCYPPTAPPSVGPFEIEYRAGLGLPLP